MALPAPNLDDRKFQDLVREARSLIPRYCPEWTDHNLSDPGITLIELFSWMVDILLYRLNKVPDKNYIKFMELIGIRLEPPKPAQADVLFRLSAPQPQAVVIPRGTEVATVRTETREAVIFTTEDDLTVTPPDLAYAFTSPDGAEFEDCMSALNRPDQRVSIFQESPAEGNALYLGFAGDISAHTLALSMASTIEGIGVDPTDPPLVWEFRDEEHDRWSELRLEKDTTGGLNTDGQVILHVPYSCTLTELNGQAAFWIRCRAVAPREDQRPYTRSPQVTSLKVESIGGTTPVSHAARFTGEVLGRSDGSPGQTFTLLNIPVLTRKPEETIMVETAVPGEYEPWQEVPNFSRSGPDDKHFTCDSVSGEVQFGPAVKQPSGEEWQYGMIPPLGREIIFGAYRSGGGVVGNVGPGTITVLKSSIPYVAWVANLQAAGGGTDAETIENAKIRAPRVLRSRTRAVAADDFEYLALEASPEVARARCIAAGAGGDGSGGPAGLVRLLLVPRVSRVDQPVPAEELELTRQVREQVQAYLDERKLLGTQLEITTARYAPVSVQARIKGKAGTDARRAASEVEKRLYRYINPVCGGSDGKGWPFGRGISITEVYAAIQGVMDFDYIEDVKLYTVDPETGERTDAGTVVNVPFDSLLCSHKHEIMVD